jgi:FSR family fosmidomycin resistance protein-like MFS transporter
VRFWKEVDARSMAALSGGHLFTDVNQGAVAALLPFLVVERGLSYTAVAGLILAATVSSSIVQPVFGHFSDRRSLPALMPGGLLLAGAGIALVGVAPSYPLIFLCVVLSGIGVAAFHPEGSRFANYVSGSRRATGMSLFSVGGNVGFALGPVITTPLVLIFGLPGTLFLILPAAVMSALLALSIPRLAGFRPRSGRPAGGERDGRDRLPAYWGPFARLIALITARSLVYFGLVTFVPLYYVQVFGASEGRANAALSVMLFAGAVGTMIGGPLADRFGRRTVVIASMLALPPLILGMSLSGELAGMVLLALIGACTIATFGVTVVMGQEYLPGRIGIASGFTIGFSIGLGGLGAPVLGAVADGFGLFSTMLVVAALPLVGLAIALTLPKKVPAAA